MIRIPTETDKKKNFFLLISNSIEQAGQKLRRPDHPTAQFPGWGSSTVRRVFSQKALSASSYASSRDREKNDLSKTWTCPHNVFRRSSRFLSYSPPPPPFDPYCPSFCVDSRLSLCGPEDLVWLSPALSPPSRQPASGGVGLRVIFLFAAPFSKSRRVTRNARARQQRALAERGERTASTLRQRLPPP